MLVLLFAALWQGSTAWSCDDDGATSTLYLVKLGSIDQLAVCNDGSEAAYYFQPSSTASSTWLVYLGGGGWCHTPETCKDRYSGDEYPHHDCNDSSEATPCFMSSKDYRKTCGKTGIFDAQVELNPLAGSNMAYVPYCSSDAHMGDAAASAATGGFHMRGQRIVQAVLADLVAKGLTRGQTLVFGGGSAGGRGAMVWLDLVPALLPGVSVLGFLDSPYYIDIAPLTPDFVSWQEQTANVFVMANASALATPNCLAAYPGASWKCIFGQYRMPFIQAPAMLLAGQDDGWQLSHNVHNYAGIETSPVYTPSEMVYVNSFGAATQKLLGTLPSHANSHAFAIHAPACYIHHWSEKSLLWELNSTGVSAATALGEFLRAAKSGGGNSLRWVDQCQGYACGDGCV